MKSPIENPAAVAKRIARPALTYSSVFGYLQVSSTERANSLSETMSGYAHTSGSLPSAVEACSSDPSLLLASAASRVSTSNTPALNPHAIMAHEPRDQ